MGQSTKDIKWLFLNPVNPNARILYARLTGVEWSNMYAVDFIGEKLAPKLREWFGFESNLNSVELWILRDPIRIDEVTPEWVANNAKDFNPTTVAIECTQTTRTVDQVLSRDGQPLKELAGDCLNLIVTVKLKVRHQEQELGEVRDTVPDLGQVMYKTMYKNYLAISAPIISTTLESKIPAELQENPETTIYDGFYHVDKPACTAALPITIYHPVFQSFTDNIATAKPDALLLIQVHRWMKKSTGVGTLKVPLAENLRAALTKILGKYMGQVVIGGAIPEGVIFKTRDDCVIPLLTMEYKQTIGESGYDPLMQASHFAWNFWRQKNLERIRDGSCCPTFIISGGGPYLAILGAIMTDKFVVQRLTDLEWLGIGQTFEDEHVYRTAQVFDSLRTALQQLDEFYDDLGNKPVQIHPRFFPRYTTYTDRASYAMVEFEYLRPLTPSNKSPFLAKIIGSGEMVVVKFVARYGAEAHHHLAEANMAPRLRFCGSLDGRDDVRRTPVESSKDTFGLHLGPLQMVVMDYVDGAHSEALKEDERPNDLHDKVKAMVDHLHGSRFVFGNLRPSNVMVSEGKTLLVDFNWAGKAGEVRYPIDLGKSITRHCGGRALEIIEKKHDLDLLEHYFGKG